MKKKPKKGAKQTKPLTKIEKTESFFHFFNPPAVSELFLFCHVILEALWQFRMCHMKAELSLLLFLSRFRKLKMSLMRKRRNSYKT